MAPALATTQSHKRTWGFYYVAESNELAIFTSIMILFLFTVIGKKSFNKRERKINSARQLDNNRRNCGRTSIESHIQMVE